MTDGDGDSRRIPNLMTINILLFALFLLLVCGTYANDLSSNSEALKNLFVPFLVFLLMGLSIWCIWSGLKRGAELEQGSGLPTTYPDGATDVEVAAPLPGLPNTLGSPPATSPLQAGINQVSSWWQSHSLSSSNQPTNNISRSGANNVNANGKNSADEAPPPSYEEAIQSSLKTNAQLSNDRNPV